MKQITFALVLLLIGCNEATKEKNLTLDFFEEMPEAIDGCSETLTYKNNAAAEKYIYVSNLQDLAFIKIDGKLIELHRDTIKSAELNEKIYRHVFKSGQYRSVLETHETGRIDLEDVKYEGNLKIYKDDSLLINVEVKGEGGC